MLDTQAIGLRTVDSTPFVVIDIETTGLVPGADRIVELAAVRVEPGGEPRLALETLVHPMRPMASTEIHGIRDEDVADAPRFEDIVGDLVEALADACLASYNSNFDIALLSRELARVGVDAPLPHICLMGVRADLDIGPAGSLEEACLQHGVPFHAGHRAAYDALSEAQLLLELLPILREKGIHQLGHLLEHSQRRYCQSLVFPSLSRATTYGLATGGPLLPRHREDRNVPDTRKALGLYYDALQAALADGILDGEEISDLSGLRDRFGFRPEQVRCLHGRLFATFLDLYTDDTWLADAEAASLRKLHGCLSELGWAPGD